jgi:UDP-glucose 4-epimerase
MKNKRVVVTGGLGFIGSNLVENLARENEVTIIDDQSSGTLNNIKHLNQDNLTIIKSSITDPGLASLFKDHDYVFHHAALISVIGSIQDPQASNEVNISGTLNVLVAARDAGIKKLIFASSAAVYGDSPALPKSEDMPVDPLSPYAITKVTGEFYCKVFQDLYGLKTSSLRYFNVFGPRQDPNSQYAAVIPKFINAIMHDQPPTIYGDGEQSRDFIFVKHVVDANIKACESDKTGVFNVASGSRITVNQLVDLINEIMGKDIKPHYSDPVAGDIKHSVADVQKARSFGYKPDTIKWFENKK